MQGYGRVKASRVLRGSWAQKPSKELLIEEGRGWGDSRHWFLLKEFVQGFLVTQLCPTLFYPVNHTQPGSSVHGNSPSKNTGVGCHALLQGFFPTQGSNPCLLHCGQILYPLSHWGSPSHPLLLLNWQVDSLPLSQMGSPSYL